MEGTSSILVVYVPPWCGEEEKKTRKCRDVWKCGGAARAGWHVKTAVLGSK